MEDILERLGVVALAIALFAAVLDVAGEALPKPWTCELPMTVESGDR